MQISHDLQQLQNIQNQIFVDVKDTNVIFVKTDSMLLLR